MISVLLQVCKEEVGLLLTGRWGCGVLPSAWWNGLGRIYTILTRKDGMLTHRSHTPHTSARLFDPLSTTHTFEMTNVALDRNVPTVGINGFGRIG